MNHERSFTQIPAIVVETFARLCPSIVGANRTNRLKVCASKTKMRAFLMTQPLSHSAGFT
jgi:hypothetical protein